MLGYLNTCRVGCGNKSTSSMFLACKNHSKHINLWMHSACSGKPCDQCFILLKENWLKKNMTPLFGLSRRRWIWLICKAVSRLVKTRLHSLHHILATWEHEALMWAHCIPARNRTAQQKLARERERARERMSHDTQPGRGELMEGWKCPEVMRKDNAAFMDVHY